ncbi:galectin-4 [Alosa pseudoharengus]|uniref:galectin-4 n=1 Tax=Alosa pseudoharengus TaxID=34774 RepID=UPI003F8BFFC5
MACGLLSPALSRGSHAGRAPPTPTTPRPPGLAPPSQLSPPGPPLPSSPPRQPNQHSLPGPCHHKASPVSQLSPPGLLLLLLQHQLRLRLQLPLQASRLNPLSPPGLPPPSLRHSHPTPAAPPPTPAPQGTSPPGRPPLPGLVTLDSQAGPVSQRRFPCQCGLDPLQLGVPYNLNFPRGVYDKLMLTITGQVKPMAKMFTVNFLRGNDIAMHINPRFNEGGKQILVRNHRQGERWGKEERNIQGPFPFAPGQPFEMKILVTYNEFKVVVNGAQVFEFKHRIRELNQIDRLNILQDINLTSINLQNMP